MKTHWPQSMVGPLQMPNAAGDTTPETPPPAPVWDAAAQKWVLPTAPVEPPPSVVWDAKAKAWRLA